MGDEALAVAAAGSKEREPTDGGRRGEHLDRHAPETGQRHGGDEPPRQRQEPDVGENDHRAEPDAAEHP